MKLNNEETNIILGKYRIIKKLGNGIFGSVYLCEVINTNINVCVKTLDTIDL